VVPGKKEQEKVKMESRVRGSPSALRVVLDRLDGTFRHHSRRPVLAFGLFSKARFRMRFLVGLAALSLLSDGPEEHPLLV